MDEATFWRTMHPARLHALLDAHFAPSMRPPAPAELEKAQSLSEYLRGG